MVKQLNKNDYEIDEKERSILLTNDGVNTVEELFSNAGILKNNNFYDPEIISGVLASSIKHESISSTIENECSL